MASRFPKILASLSVLFFAAAYALVVLPAEPATDRPVELTQSSATTAKVEFFSEVGCPATPASAKVGEVGVPPSAVPPPLPANVRCAKAIVTVHGTRVTYKTDLPALASVAVTYYSSHPAWVTTASGSRLQCQGSALSGTPAPTAVKCLRISFAGLGTNTPTPLDVGLPASTASVEFYGASSGTGCSGAPSGSLTVPPAANPAAGLPAAPLGVQCVRKSVSVAGVTTTTDHVLPGPPATIRVDFYATYYRIFSLDGYPGADAYNHCYGASKYTTWYGPTNAAWAEARSHPAATLHVPAAPGDAPPAPEDARCVAIRFYDSDYDPSAWDADHPEEEAIEFPSADGSASDTIEGVFFGIPNASASIEFWGPQPAHDVGAGACPHTASDTRVGRVGIPISDGEPFLPTENETGCVEVATTIGGTPVVYSAKVPRGPVRLELRLYEGALTPGDDPTEATCGGAAAANVSVPPRPTDVPLSPGDAPAIRCADVWVYQRNGGTETFVARLAAGVPAPPPLPTLASAEFYDAPAAEGDDEACGGNLTGGATVPPDPETLDLPETPVRCVRGTVTVGDTPMTFMISNVPQPPTVTPPSGVPGGVSAPYFLELRFFGGNLSLPTPPAVPTCGGAFVAKVSVPARSGDADPATLPSSGIRCVSVRLVNSTNAQDVRSVDLGAPSAPPALITFENGRLRVHNPAGASAVCELDLATRVLSCLGSEIGAEGPGPVGVPVCAGAPNATLDPAPQGPVLARAAVRCAGVVAETIEVRNDGHHGLRIVASGNANYTIDPNVAVCPGAVPSCFTVFDPVNATPLVRYRENADGSRTVEILSEGEPGHTSHTAYDVELVGNPLTDPQAGIYRAGPGGETLLLSFAKVRDLYRTVDPNGTYASIIEGSLPASRFAKRVFYEFPAPSCPATGCTRRVEASSSDLAAGTAKLSGRYGHTFEVTIPNGSAANETFTNVRVAWAVGDDPDLARSTGSDATTRILWLSRVSPGVFRGTVSAADLPDVSGPEVRFLLLLGREVGVLNSVVIDDGDGRYYRYVLDAAAAVPTVATDPPASGSYAFAVRWPTSPASPWYWIERRIASENASWGLWQNATPASNGTFQGECGKSYSFRARAMDALGNPGAWSAPANRSVPNEGCDPNTAPTVSFTAPSTAGTRVSGMYTLRWRMQDSGGPATVVFLHACPATFQNVTECRPMNPLSNATQFDWDSRTVRNGEWKFRIVVTDGALRTTALSVAVRVDNGASGNLTGSAGSGGSSGPSGGSGTIGAGTGTGGASDDTGSEGDLFEGGEEFFDDGDGTEDGSGTQSGDGTDVAGNWLAIVTLSVAMLGLGLAGLFFWKRRGA